MCGEFGPGAELAVEIDYAGHASNLNSGLASRLTLGQFIGCAEVDRLIDEESGEVKPVTQCGSVIPLEAEHDRAAGRFTVGLDQLQEVGAGGGAGLSFLSSTGGWLGILSGSNYEAGAYSATPLANVLDFQVSTYTGSFDTTFPIDVPPPAAGAAPSVSLGYSSGSIDGMTSDKNNQAGAIGLGWSLNAGGSITRHFHPYDCQIPTGDLCPLDDIYSLTLNGVSSRLVETATADEYRLEADPMWRIKMKTGSGTTFEEHGEYWEVTTPDGTVYEFGTSDDSLDHAPVYTNYSSGNKCASPWTWTATEICYKAWRWNLTTSTDTYGNVVEYKYRQEIDHTDVRSFTNDQGEVARASHLETILYTDNGALDPKARVRFLYEVRCDDNYAWAKCTVDADFVDSPVDQACRPADGTCNRSHPVFFTELRLDGIQTHVKEEGTGEWRIVKWWDLEQSFPTNHNTETTEEYPSEPKMWLDSITQRPGSLQGSPAKHSAYSQIEYEDYSSQTGTTSVKASDYGAGNARGVSENDELVFKNVDFGDEAPDKLFVRYASDGRSGDIDVWIDEIGGSGTKIATLSITDTGSFQDWEYVWDATISSSATGIHDVYFDVGAVTGGAKLANLNFFRFTPETNSLDGLNPTIFEAATDGSVTSPDGYYHRNRAETLTGIHDVGRDPMRMPRLGKITNPLGGQVDITYGQDWDWGTGDCPTSAAEGIHNGEPCDYFTAWYDGERPAFNKWKAKEVESYDSFSENLIQKQTYTYSVPNWRLSDIPGYDDANCSAQPCNTYSEFAGHEAVTVKTINELGGTIGEVEYTYFTGLGGTNTISRHDGQSPDDDEELAGRITQVEARDAGTWVTREYTDYEVINTISGADAHFIAPDRIVSETNTSSADRETLVIYEYDQTYGSLTGAIDCGEIGSGASSPCPELDGDERYVERTYDRNVAAWILNTPRYEKLWEGVAPGATGNSLSHTRYYYGPTFAHNLDPDHPEPTRIRQNYGHVGIAPYIDSESEFDAYGRVVTIWDGNATAQVQTGPGTTTIHDTTHGYVTKVANPLNHEVEVHDYDPGLGVVIEIDDANGNKTYSEFDAYGRLVKVWFPTEEINYPGGNPSIEYSYFEHDPSASPNGTPARVLTRTLQDGPSDYAEQFDHYDGFGRLIQTQRDASSSTERLVQARYYNSAGLIKRESAVQLDTNGDAGADYLTFTWTGANPTVELQTVHHHDDLGRIIEIETIADDDPANALWDIVIAYDGWDRTITNRNDIDVVELTRFVGHGFLPFHAAWSA